jgi:hypothetical protein
MFTRRHRIGRYDYIEALESYRDPDTGTPKHRCVARWRADLSLAEAIGRTRLDVETAQRNVAYWRGLKDGTVNPKRRVRIGLAPDHLRFWESRIKRDTPHLAALERAAGVLGADERSWRRLQRLSMASRLDAFFSADCPDTSP